MTESSSQNPPPDFVGYENLIEFMEKHRLFAIDGDIVEIGAFMGGGTVKLAAWAGKHGKQVYVIDVFDPQTDDTMSPTGVSAREVYEAFLQGQSMFDVYRAATRRFDNITTLRKDSRTVRFPEDRRFVFAFIDGCHQEAFVLSDFHLVWPHIVRGGAVGFHDYEYADWPEVTTAVKRILSEHGAEIAETSEIVGSYDIRSLLLIKK